MCIECCLSRKLFIESNSWKAWLSSWLMRYEDLSMDQRDYYEGIASCSVNVALHARKEARKDLQHRCALLHGVDGASCQQNAIGDDPLRSLTDNEHHCLRCNVTSNHPSHPPVLAQRWFRHQHDDFSVTAVRHGADLGDANPAFSLRKFQLGRKEWSTKLDCVDEWCTHATQPGVDQQQVPEHVQYDSVCGCFCMGKDPRPLLRLRDDIFKGFARVKTVEAVKVQALPVMEILLALELSLQIDSDSPASHSVRLIGQVAAASANSGRFKPTMTFARFVIPEELGGLVSNLNEIPYSGARLRFGRVADVISTLADASMTMPPSPLGVFETLLEDEAVKLVLSPVFANVDGAQVSWTLSSWTLSVQRVCQHVRV
jgi:hypothetical protein